jgi:hypothetical protein
MGACVGSPSFRKPKQQERAAAYEFDCPILDETKSPDNDDGSGGTDSSAVIDDSTGAAGGGGGAGAGAGGGGGNCGGGKGKGKRRPNPTNPTTTPTNLTRLQYAHEWSGRNIVVDMDLEVLAMTWHIRIGPLNN